MSEPTYKPQPETWWEKAGLALWIIVAAIGGPMACVIWKDLWEMWR